MDNRIITMLTDFGLRDPYVAEMKAVIFGICPTANIVDISHDVEKFNVRMGSFILASAVPFFPKSTIHIAVVDPGVGTERHGLCVETDHGYFVGPDNGLMALAASVQRVKRVFAINNPKFMLPRVSPVFHGRDVFAPVAAHLANGVDPSDFGSRIESILVPSFAKVVKNGNRLAGEVLHVDGFGNVVTNIHERDFESLRDVKELYAKAGHRIAKMVFSTVYGSVEKGQLLAIIGSHGFLEISVNQGSASQTLGLKSEDKVAVSF